MHICLHVCHVACMPLWGSELSGTQAHVPPPDGLSTSAYTRSVSGRCHLVGCACGSYTCHPALPHKWFRVACLHTCHVPELPSNGVVTSVLNHAVFQNFHCQPRLTCWDTYHFPVPPRVGMSILVPVAAVFQQHHVLAQAPLFTRL